MKTARFFFALALSLTLLTLGGCGDDESLMEAQSTASAPLFARYVAMGNSITAGYQSGGINTFTQNDSYAVMRQTPAETIHNVAVPGSEVVDVLDNAAGGQFGSNPNALTTVLLGGRTQLEAALDADPTFVSLWTGNNDVLGAALTGDTRLITPPDSFRSRYTRILDALEDSGVQGGMLIGVADVTLVPVLQPGAFYLGLSQDSTAQQALPDNVSVSSSCAPRAEGGRLVSFSYSSNLIARADTVDQAVALDCADDAGTLTEQEVGALTSAVNDYNDFISSQAEERGWAYVNPNDLFR
ncbi:MAG: SGNH/GDSL hydrolase family protein, partial [Bacteroidetes bacterium QS_1_65_9]